MTSDLPLPSHQATSHSSAMLTSEGAHAMEQDDHGAKMAATAAGGSDGAESTMTAALAADADVEMEEADMTRWTEAEFEEKCTYVVKDTAREAGPDGGDAMTTTSATRAEASLPRNLTFRHPADSEEELQYRCLLTGGAVQHFSDAFPFLD
ncbi:PR domain zinc finger protein 1 [Liparis tanakae]|uniref:PR domain zinc finger protein 1 n=1 Tax=Liparis tanakae TaxID=230148 RepID=A0A4Z2E788_9TELE|nr:PR domain zinc finger protein 1 [Liparis tanakae]